MHFADNVDLDQYVQSDLIILCSSTYTTVSIDPVSGQ